MVGWAALEKISGHYKTAFVLVYYTTPLGSSGKDAAQTCIRLPSRANLGGDFVNDKFKMGGGASQQAAQEVTIDPELAAILCKHLDSKGGSGEMQEVVQGCICSTMYCLVKEASSKAKSKLMDKAKEEGQALAEKAGKEVLDVVKSELEDLGWMKEAAEDPEAVSETFKEFGSLAVGLAGGVLGAAGCFPAALLSGIVCSWLKKSKKPLDVTNEMRKCLDEQAAKELTGALNSALSLLSEVKDTKSLKGKIAKADQGEGKLRDVIELFFTQLESAGEQPKGFEEGQAEMFHRLQFAICVRLVALKLQRELESDNMLENLEKVRIHYQEKLKALGPAYVRYRNAKLLGCGEIHEWVLWQDTVTGSYIFAQTRANDPCIVVGKNLTVANGEGIQPKVIETLKRGDAEIISSDPKACRLVCQQEMRNQYVEYLDYLADKFFKVIVAPTNQVLWT